MQQLTDFKEIESAVNQYGEIIVSKNDNDDVIAMSLDEYRKKRIDEEMERKLLQSEEDYNNGRVRDTDEVIKEWEEKYCI